MYIVLQQTLKKWHAEYFIIQKKFFVSFSSQYSAEEISVSTYFTE